MSSESEKTLRSLGDNVNEKLRVLSRLGQPSEQWDTIIIHMNSQKLDCNTGMKWEEHRNSFTEIPTLDQFNNFSR